jgi:hypothetical protein
MLNIQESGEGHLHSMHHPQALDSQGLPPRTNHAKVSEKAATEKQEDDGESANNGAEIDSSAFNVLDADDIFNDVVLVANKDGEDDSDCASETTTIEWGQEPF